jgi:NAD(P)-dependent dehydrogenase (short-subunit alcohol dehydrogenase family)/acyl carrier protein
VAEALRAAGVEVVSATPGAPADYVELIESVSPDRVVHLLSLEGTGLDAGLFGVLHAVQALASTGAAEHVPLSVVTAGTQSVTGADLASPQHAMVAGVLHSAPYDVEGLTWQHVDVDESDRGLIAELLVGEPGLVALRHGRRWVPDFAPLHLSETTAGLRDRGVYLITGGLGGIGRALAADLAARVPGVGLALVGRTPPGPAVAAELDALRALGARILVLAADVASVPDLVRVRQQLIDEFGALHGIVHAAGVAGGGITETRSTDGVAAVLRPKRAVDALEEVFADLPLDFVVLFSSISGTLGGLGEVDYAAANAYLDAYAQRATSRWTAPVRSLAWPGWRDTGMLAAALGERASEPFEHPLLQRRRGHLFYGTISPRTHWVLAEHAVAGVGLLPGTAQLDAMRAAFEAVVPSPGGDVIPELADVMFAAPLYVADDDSADITVTVTPAGSQAAMVSFSSGETVHSRGQARWVSAPEPARLDLAELRSRLVDRPELTRVETRNIRFGPHWQAARSILTSDTEELALLELPDDLTDETTQWALHPALVDLATTRWSVRDSDSGVVPMGYGQLTWRRRLPRRIWVYRVATGSSNAGGVLTTDFLIVDDDGNEVARIGEFMARQTDHLALLESQDADSPAAAPSVSAAPVPEATVDDTAWISPAEGAEAFRRALTAPEGHLIISPRPYAYLQERARRQAAQQLAEAVAGIAGVAGVGDSGDSVEAAITRVWSAVLGVDDIGPDDDFFDLGGNSLVAVQVISDIRKVTGVKLPMRSLFETPTVAGMTKMVTELAAEPVITAAPAPTGPTIPRLARPT